MVLLGSHDGLEHRLHIMYCVKQLAHRRAGKREMEWGEGGSGRNKRTWVAAEGMEV